MPSYVTLFISILFNVVGNHLFKFASKAMGGTLLDKQFLLFAGAGFFFYGLSAILYILALRNIPLSVAYPLLSVTYIITIFTSYYLFSEPITPNKLIGAVLILLGVFVMNKAVLKL